MSLHPRLLALGTLVVAGCCMAASPPVDEAVVAAAREALSHALAQQHPGLRIELHEDIDATTAGELSASAAWRVRGVDSALRRRMTVLMEPANAPAGATRIGFLVHAQAPAWKLAHAGHPALVLHAGDVTATTEDAIATPDLATVDDISKWRLVRPLPEGRVLRTGDLADARSVLRGDAVDVHLDLGAVSLDTRGVALNAGRPGELVKVALPGRRDTVEGIVGDARQILVKP